MPERAPWFARRAPALTVAALVAPATGAAHFARPLFGFDLLFILPVLLASGLLSAWEIAVAGSGFALLARALAPPAPGPSGAAHVLAAAAGFTAVGLLVKAWSRLGERAGVQVAVLEKQARALQDAEHHARIAVETSCAAIVSLDAAGAVLEANEAARHLLGSSAGSMRGEAIAAYLPALAAVRLPDGRLISRGTLECRGQRRSGESFLAQVWYSTYYTPRGRRVTAIFCDRSDAVRNRLRRACAGTTAAGVLLDEWRVAVEPCFRAAGISLRWDVPDDLPVVWGLHDDLLLAFVRLGDHIRRTLDGALFPELSGAAEQVGGRLLVHLRHAAGGRACSEPGQAGAEWHVARAILLAYGGDVRAVGRGLTVELAAAGG